MYFDTESPQSMYDDQPEVMECDTCGKHYNFELYCILENDSCHHCNHYDGKISDKQFECFQKEFEYQESKEVQICM